MKFNMDDSRLVNVTHLQEFLKGSQKLVVSLEKARISEKYAFIERIVKRFSYQSLTRTDKHIALLYLHKVTGYKKGRLYQFIKRAEKRRLQKAVYVRSNPNKIYVTADIKLLEETDELHLRLSEDATKKILEREYVVFGR